MRNVFRKKAGDEPHRRDCGGVDIGRLHVHAERPGEDGRER